MRPKMLQIMFRVVDKERVMQLTKDLGINFPHINEEEADRMLRESRKRNLDIRFTAVDLSEMLTGGGGFPDGSVNSEQEMLGGLMNHLAGGGNVGGTSPQCQNHAPRDRKPRYRKKGLLKGRPKRDRKICGDDIANLAIAFNTAKNLDEFLGQV